MFDKVNKTGDVQCSMETVKSYDYGKGTTLKDNANYDELLCYDKKVIIIP